MINNKLTLADSTKNPNVNGDFNISLGRDLFSNPQMDRSNAVVMSNGSCFSEGIEVGDLIKVDFTANQIDRDGLYIVTLDDQSIMYQRFQYAPVLKAIYSDDAIIVTPKMQSKTKVVGRVKVVYKSRMAP